MHGGRASTRSATAGWARLHEGDRAYKLVNEFIRHNVCPNLWGFHRPFQIDCNFGYAAGVNEMLLQSHMGFIDILPSLPEARPQGSVTGMPVRGGFEMDLAWKDGKLTKALIRNRTNPTGTSIRAWRSPAKVTAISPTWWSTPTVRGPAR